jgi:hypothetical protein
MKYLKMQKYTCYLGNASNPFILEPVFLGSIFHNYKQLLQETKKDVIIDERTIEFELKSLL